MTIPRDHFAGFTSVTDTLGGVEFDNPVAFESNQLTGHTFPQGRP